jgi:multicomponent Na+:H+ antiporter subunit D
VSPRFLLLPVAIPLAAAAVAVLAHRWVLLQRLVGFAGGVALLGTGAALIVATADGTVLATQVGGWPPGFAIAFAADPLAALMLTASGVVILACTAFAAARREDEHPLFHPLALVLAAGVAGSFLTADLFNLFVFFEVMLAASYVLVTLGGGRDQIRGGAIYVATNLLASTLLVAGVALAYGTAGTVNMAALAEQAATNGAVAVAGGFFLVAFGVKAALVPVHGWISRAYPVASPAVAALFSGLLTKVGVYAIYRVYAVVFGGDPGFRPALLIVAGLTMLVGVLGAVGAEEMRAILSVHIVSQIGYMIMGLALFTTLGLAAGIFYIVHNIMVKTSLFLVAGAVETFRGTGALDRLGGMARRHPILAVAFAFSALSLAGLPPLSGFFGKLGLVRAGFELAEWWVVAVAVLVSFLTLFSMMKIWTGVFWGKDPGAAVEEASDPGVVPVARAGTTGAVFTRRRAVALVTPAVILGAIALALGPGAEGLLRLSGTAAEALLDPAPYVQAVLGR